MQRCIKAASVFKKAVYPSAIAVMALFSSSSSWSDNPIISQVYTADPAARVFDDGRLYVITSHDQDNADGYDTMVDYYLFSTDDMVNWQDHGIVWNSPQNTSWAANAYAPDFIQRNGKYYLYFPNSGNSVGVAVADRPEGPYRDPLGRPLLDRSIPNANVTWLFDPGVFIDDDGQAYLYFGGGGEGNTRVIRLNDDMISTSGSAISIPAPNFFEASYMHKRNGIYYFSYSTDSSAGLTIDYMTSTSPTSGFQHRGTVLANPWDNRHNNNHQSFVEYKGEWYVFYHNRAVSLENGHSVYSRSVNVDRVSFNGTAMNKVNAGPAGVQQLKYVNALTRNEAETFDTQNGIKTERCREGTQNLMMSSGDWVKISGVDFGTGATGMRARVATEFPSSMEIILDNVNNAPIATMSLNGTGGWQTYTTQSVSFPRVSGVHDLYLRSTGYHNLNWYQFTGGAAFAGGRSVTVEVESLASQSSFSPLSVRNAFNASSGKYAVWNNNGYDQYLSSPSSSARGQVAIRFALSQSADVDFDLRANLPNSKDDSFYYRLDNGGWRTFNNASTNGWQQMSVGSFDNVSSGNHTLYLLRREDGAQLDSVTLTPSTGLIRSN